MKTTPPPTRTRIIVTFGVSLAAVAALISLFSFAIAIALNTFFPGHANLFYRGAVVTALVIGLPIALAMTVSFKRQGYDAWSKKVGSIVESTFLGFINFP